jgi:hypothetical protein
MHCIYVLIFPLGLITSLKCDKMWDVHCGLEHDGVLHAAPTVASLSVSNCVKQLLMSTKCTCVHCQLCVGKLL